MTLPLTKIKHCTFSRDAFLKQKIPHLLHNAALRKIGKQNLLLDLTGFCHSYLLSNQKIFAHYDNKI